MSSTDAAYQTLTLDRDQRGVATLTLARPDKHNALNAVMIDELSTAAAALAADAAVRVVVLAAQGKTFCAGGDLGWMREQAGKDRAGRMAESSRLATMLRALDTLPKPLIARVQGAAYGGGIGMMAVCDIVVAAGSAKFALTETRLGLIPATIGPYVVARLGEGAARQVFMNARTFDAERARALGLVAAVAADADLDAAVAAEVEPFLACAPGAIAEAKALCRTLARDSPPDTLTWTAERLAERWESEEASEGIAAFFERRKPPWAS